MYSRFAKTVLNLLMILSLSSCAQHTVKNTNESISKDAKPPIDYGLLKKAKTAKLVLMPWPNLSWQGVTKWDEDTFKQLGCAYSTQNVADIGSLTQLLVRADIKTNSSYNKKLFTPLEKGQIWITANQALYLTFADGSEMKFVFDIMFGKDDGNFGQFSDTARGVNNYPISAHGSLPWHLTFWASKLGKPITQDFGKATASETLGECETFIRRYVYMQS